ncbi:hypothetical protein MC885_002107 [Smutsia gigantea]|nr:hypothetical protein MC885_002107 [Smutsia gigantea]
MTDLMQTGPQSVPESDRSSGMASIMKETEDRVGTWSRAEGHQAYTETEIKEIKKRLGLIVEALKSRLRTLTLFYRRGKVLKVFAAGAKEEMMPGMFVQQRPSDKSKKESGLPGSAGILLELGLHKTTVTPEAEAFKGSRIPVCPFSLYILKYDVVNLTSYPDFTRCFSHEKKENTEIPVWLPDSCVMLR